MFVLYIDIKTIGDLLVNLIYAMVLMFVKNP
jgi:hypothetical protein